MNWIVYEKPVKTLEQERDKMPVIIREQIGRGSKLTSDHLESPLDFVARSQVMEVVGEGGRDGRV